MFIFLPPSIHQGKRISTADLAKLNECNVFIKKTILESGDALVHGFNIKRCIHPLLPEDQTVYVLRTINGNPLTTAGHLKDIWDSVVELGRKFYATDAAQEKSFLQLAGVI